jgi:hypothetical protein
LLGENLQWDDEWRVKVNYFSEHPARISEAIAIAMSYVSGGGLSGCDKKLASAVAMAREHMSGSLCRHLNGLPARTRAVIIDWANLPALDIWKNCDMKIIVTADDAQRFSRVKNRLGSRAFTDEELQNLVTHASLPYDKIDCDMRVHNDTTETLEQAAERIRASYTRESINMPVIRANAIENAI